MQKVLITMLCLVCFALSAQDEPERKSKPAAKPKAKTTSKAPATRPQPETGENLVEAVKRVVSNLKASVPSKDDAAELQRKLDAVALETDRALRNLQTVPNAKLQKDLKQQVNSALNFVRGLGTQVVNEVDTTVKRLNEMSESIQ